MKNHRSSLVLVAGGTGGHIFPAWAVARVLCQRNCQVSWITDHRGATYKENRPDFYEVLCLLVPPLSGSLWKKGEALLQFCRSFFKSLYFLKKHKTQVVWGFGGYASLPPLLAAWVLRIPVGIHQADALLGRANRFLAKIASDLATSFPVVEGVPQKIHQTYTGLPLRPEIEALAKASYPDRSLDDPFHLLVVGGSQGAALWGKRLPQAIALLPPEKQKLFHIVQQCRLENLDQTQKAFSKTLATVILTPFIENMADALRKAHFVMARAGASTLMELAASGRPALFIPYPFAADDHQTINAQKMVVQGGSWMMAEKDFTVLALKNFLEERLESFIELPHCSEKMKLLWQKKAAEKLADLITSKAKLPF